MRTVITLGLAVAVMTIGLTGCQSFKKEPLFPLSQYEAEKPGHGLVMTMVGTPRYLPGKQQAWLEECDYKLERKAGEPYVLFPDYTFTNCKQVGAVHNQ
jgi:hypothetical protein